MDIFFRCKSDGVQFYLDTDTKPTIGDTVLVDHKNYKVANVVWCLKAPPAQSRFLIDIVPIVEVKI